MNIINDNIYGAIKLQDKEKKIIDLPIFQRLRGIQQQGLAYLVFPSAVHTRFSHSLGVLHIINKYCDHLKSDYGGSRLEESDIRKLRFAALLHDIGHYPFSHLGEWVYRRRKNKEGAMHLTINGFNDQNSPLDNPSPLCWIGGCEEYCKEAHHENLGAYMISNRSELKEIIGDNDIIDSICNIIQGSETDMVYRSLLHSSLDSDRLDYLLRDSAALGVKYGLVDYEYLINSSCISQDQPETNRRLVYKEKSVSAIEHYLMSRYFAKTQVVYHRTVQAYEDILKLILWVLSEEGEIYNNFDEVKEVAISNDIMTFNDRYLLNKIDCINSEKFSPLGFFIETLRNRHKIEFLFDFRCARPGCKNDKKCFRNILYDTWKNEDDRNQLIKKLDLDPKLFGFCKQEVKIDYSKEQIEKMEDVAIAEAPQIELKDGRIYFFNAIPGSVIRKILGTRLEIFRIYFINDVKKQYDLEKIRRKIKGELGGEDCELLN